MGCGSSTVTPGKDPVNAIAKETGLEKKFIKMYYTSFNDICPAGEMNEKQFVEMFMKLHKQKENPLFSKFLGRVFLLFDVDGSDTVSFVEVIKILHMVINGDVVDRLILVYRLCDTDRSHSIEKDEFVGTIKDLVAFVPGDAASNKDSLLVMANDAFSRMDKENNGKVTPAEYVDALKDDSATVDDLIILLLKALVRIVTAQPPVTQND